MDLDLRKLRYFAAVAEHQHFGRAAEQLYIAQPVLSRQIRAFERELGCELLVRTTRSVRLTPAGELLRDQAAEIFASVDSAVRRVHEADRGVRRLVVGFASGLHVSDAVRAFSATHPGVEIDLLHVPWWEQVAPLRDGRVDVGYLRRPFDDAGLDVIPVGGEQRVVCLPRTHPLARRRALATADLDGQPVLDARARRTSSVEQKFELVAAGEGIAVVPRSVAEWYPRPDLVAIPITDAEQYETCVAVLTGRREPHVRGFVGLAVEVMSESLAAAG